ncbi:hypothetical protein JMN32_18920 [Fulvivirga sp. 29W222]|uniref:Pyruvate carboxyltransferase domain-containing protein n=2 Tax=Fulvivirga marina TaxID=2494733 RepID=A0A937FYK4_9BACT|nr:hypothetical protein [Fulvivirga marina]
MEKKIKILDPTIREAGYLNGFKFSIEEVKSFIDISKRIGTDIIEIGHGLGPGNELPLHSHEEYVYEAKQHDESTSISIFGLAGLCKKTHLQSIIKSGLDVFRVGFVGFENTPFPFREALPLLEEAKKQGLFTCLNVLDTYRIKDKELIEVCNTVAELSPDVIYIVDSSGALTDKEIGKKIEILSEHSDSEIGYHGHDNLRLATYNSVYGAREGCTYLDATFMGMGRGAGNANLEVLIALLERYGMREADFVKLYEASKKVANLFNKDTEILEHATLGYYGVMDYIGDKLDKSDNRAYVEILSKLDKLDTPFIPEEEIKLCHENI